MMRAVIFDMDGVVADTETVAFIADCKVLKSVCAIKGEGYLRRRLEDGIGIPARQVYNRILSENKIDSDVNELLKRREAEVEKALASKILKPSSGFNELVKNLKEKGYKVALASSASRRTMENVLSALKIKGDFSLIVSADDVKMNKPAPDIYLDAARRLNLGPDECFAVEDSETGVHSAKSAGLKCIALRTKQTAEHDLSSADVIVSSLKEIKVEALDRI